MIHVETILINHAQKMMHIMKHVVILQLSQEIVVKKKLLITEERIVFQNYVKNYVEKKWNYLTLKSYL